MKRAKVTRVDHYGDNTNVYVEAKHPNPKKQYPWKAKLVLPSDGYVPTEGEQVEFDADWPESGKPWQDKASGEWRSGGIQFYHPTVRTADGYTPEPDPPAPDDFDPDAIPYFCVPSERGGFTRNGHVRHETVLL